MKIINNKKTGSGWTASDILAPAGRTTIITGAGGLGYETALAALAKVAGDITLAGRNPAKGAAAVSKIRVALLSEAPQHIRFEVLDLASLTSIREFAARMYAERHSLDLLINNAGVMAPPHRETTADGFELQFGTNYLGPFALSALQLQLLRQGEKASVVNLTSMADRSGAINFENLQATRQNQSMQVYGQSKLANLIFSLELQLWSEAQGWAIKARSKRDLVRVVTALALS